MAKSVEKKLVIGIGALALLVLGARALHMLLAGAILVGKKPAKS